MFVRDRVRKPVQPGAVYETREEGRWSGGTILGMSDPAIPPILRDDIDQPTCEPSAGRRLRLRQQPPASARSPPAVQSALGRAALAGHSYACSSGFPSESEASATSVSSVRTGWTIC